MSNAFPPPRRKNGFVFLGYHGDDSYFPVTTIRVGVGIVVHLADRFDWKEEVLVVVNFVATDPHFVSSS